MRLVNIVAIVYMRKPFDLKELNKKLEGTEITPNWLKMRKKPENYYIAFYKSGKFLITGAKTYEEVENTSKQVIKLLENAKINNSIDKVEVKNIVMTDRINITVPLQDIITNLNSKNASYEPEQFPGLFYKDRNGISYTLFNSGKVIITGITEPGQAEKGLEEFIKLIT